MKKGLFLFIFLVGLYGFLPAQSSASSFTVQSADHIGNYNSRNDFERTISNMGSEWERINNNMQQQIARQLGTRVTTYTIWVEEFTRLEEALVDRAFQQIPESPRVGSGWLVDLRASTSLTSHVIYNIFIYRDSRQFWWYVLKTNNHFY